MKDGGIGMKKIILTILLIASMGLCGCNSTPLEATEISYVPIIEEIESGYNYEIFVDNETGVEYILITNRVGCGIQPRYDTDGTIRVRNIDK